MEAVNPMSRKLGVASLPPCVAYHLDGNELHDARRHAIAFSLAMALREPLVADRARMEQAVAMWANSIGYPTTKSAKAVTSALRRTAKGDWQWYAPGLKKKTGSLYAEALGPICASVGCPANCPPYANSYSGPSTETYDRFVQRGWSSQLRRERFYVADEVYKAICVIERRLKFAPGSRLYTTYDKLALIAGCHKTTVGRALLKLAALGVIEFEPGSGSGPHARDRRASVIRRVVPIPPTPPQAYRRNNNR